MVVVVVIVAAVVVIVVVVVAAVAVVLGNRPLALRLCSRSLCCPCPTRLNRPR
jgi:hypothetical protein